MARRLKGEQISSWAAPKIENFEGAISLKRLQECLNILRDIMVPGALPEALGAPVIMLNRSFREVREILRIERHTPS